MLRPLHFVLLLLAIAFVVSVPVPDQVAENIPSNIEERAQANDLEADASYWGYARPWRYGWGGGLYGRGWGWGGRGWGGGWYGRGWGGRGWGWW
ncbi:PREDICTED: neuropeptide-like protein 32 [Polistes canadensis]|uniref:neuropeptide-like protein 32 n=1 Tax=Polistes canadensis TaxID=91411 RepID=UPI000718F05B|nr:PREDICTED: neuropeptide-like protein 32 [Polistes canadensis]